MLCTVITDCLPRYSKPLWAIKYFHVVTKVWPRGLQAHKCTADVCVFFHDCYVLHLRRPNVWHQFSCLHTSLVLWYCISDVVDSCLHLYMINRNSFYVSANLINGAGGSMFSGCTPVCACSGGGILLPACRRLLVIYSFFVLLCFNEDTNYIIVEFITLDNTVLLDNLLKFTRLLHKCGYTGFTF